jgi:surfactin synthase thioesterase subunit
MDADKNNPHFILLPGLDGTGILAQDFAKEFPYSKDLTVIVYPQSIEKNTLDQLAQIAENEILKNQYIDQNHCVFIGESFGGLVLLEVLKRNKIKPKALIFLVAFAETPKPKLLSLVTKLPIDSLPWASIPKFLLKHFAIGSDATEEQIKLVQLTSSRVVPKILAHRLRIIESNPMKALQAHWTTPCLDIQASHDKAVPKKCAEWFKQHFSQFQLNIINGGHFLLHTRTQECIRSIEQFTKRLS